MAMGLHETARGEGDRQGRGGEYAMRREKEKGLLEKSKQGQRGG